MAKKTNASKTKKATHVFGKTAVHMGLITVEQLKICLAMQNRERGDGEKPRTIGRILIDQGFLNEAQVKMVIEEARKKAEPLRKVAGYDIIAEIGRGAMGTVYKARQMSLERNVALKLIPRSLLAEKERKRFAAEAQSAARLNHENIVKAIDVGETDEWLFFAMELFEGTNLLKILLQRRRLPEAQVCEIGLSMARALAHANANNMVHRDIKPENILMNTEGMVKLTDMGLAKSTDAEGADALSGSVVGTPYYISPEQIRAEPDVDIRTDIYSLGATLYYLVTGTRPFEAAKPIMVLKKHLSEPLVPPVERYSGVSAEMNRILQKMMEKKREKRHQNPEELREDFTRLRNLGPVAAARETGATLPAGVASTAAPRYGRPKKRAKASSLPLILGGLGAAVAVIVILAIVMGGGKGDPAKDGPSSDGPAATHSDKPDEPEDAGTETKIPGISEFEAIRAWGRENPGDVDEVIRRLGALRKKYPRTRMVSMCRSEIATWEQKKKEGAVQALSALRETVDRLVSENRFGPALEEIRRFPDALATDSIRVQLTTLSDDVLRRARVEAQRIAGLAEVAAKKRDWAKAATQLRAVEAFGIPSLWKSFSRRFEDYLAARVGAAHLTVHKRLLAEIEEKGLDAGAALITARLGSDLPAEVKDLLREDSLGLDWARGISSALRSSLAERARSEVEFFMRDGTLAQGVLLKIVGKELVVKGHDGKAKNIPLSLFRNSTVAKLVSANTEAKRFHMACFAWYLRQDAAATESFLRRCDPDRAQVRRLGMTVHLWAADRLDDLLSRAEERLGAGDIEGARGLVRQVLSKYRGLSPYFGAERRVLAVLKDLNRGTSRPPLAEALLAGEMDWPGRRKLRLTYRFDSPFQAADLALRGGDWSVAEGFLFQKASKGGSIEATLPVSWNEFTVQAEIKVDPVRCQGVGLNFLQQPDGRRLAFDLRTTKGKLAGNFLFKSDLDLPFMRALGPWMEMTGEGFQGFEKILLIVTRNRLRAMVGGLGSEVLQIAPAQWQAYEEFGFQRFGVGAVGVRACRPMALRKLEISGDPSDRWVKGIAKLGGALDTIAAGEETSLLRGGCDVCWAAEAGQVDAGPDGADFVSGSGVFAMPLAGTLLAGRSFVLTVEVMPGKGALFVRFPTAMRGSTWLFQNASTQRPEQGKDFPFSMAISMTAGKPFLLRFVVEPKGVRFGAPGKEAPILSPSRLRGTFTAGPPGYPLAVGCIGSGWKLKDIRIKPLN